MNVQKSTTVLFMIFFLVATTGAAFGQLTPHEAIPLIQKGINLGNTHEAPYEGSWNNPRAEEYYFDLYKEAGFQLVRIPVRWDNYTGKTTPYKVSETWLKRIEEVADWGLNRGLFVIINSHHDDWIKQSYTTANKARFDSIWTQIALHFKDKPEQLIFEVLNEPHGLTKAQNDDMHARILSIIRKSNPTRLVIFQGHNWGGSDELLTAAIPEDDYIIGSFHSYDPYLFGLEGQGTWGSSYDYLQLENKFKAVSNWSATNNVPVFLGEFGALSTADYNSRMRHYRAYVEFSLKYGFAFAAWDDGGNFRIMERQQKTWNELKDILIYTNARSPVATLKLYQDSIIQVNWQMKTTDHDSIRIQRKRGPQLHYTDIAMLEPGATQYNDIKPLENSYHNYRVIAWYGDTTEVYSHPVRIFFPAWVKPERKPFHGSPASVPGVVEAEDFDLGGEGLAYHDADAANIPGKYRPGEGVDIYDRLGDGFHVGNAIPGEWLEYSLNVQSEGWYTITTYIAALQGGGTFQLKVDTVMSDIIAVKSSNSALNTLPYTTRMYLKAGEQILRFSILSSPNYNIDKMIFEMATSAHISTAANNFTAFQNQHKELIIRFAGENPESVYLYNISGTLLYTGKNIIPETRIPAGLLPAGVYMIRCNYRTGIQSQKIILK
jgi:aryl-phospho-beta-D-glucosidase BglC (GH1 family)